MGRSATSRCATVLRPCARGRRRPSRQPQSRAGDGRAGRRRATGSPNRSSAWSTRCAPRSRCGPPASSASSRHASASGTPISKRDSMLSIGPSVPSRHERPDGQEIAVEAAVVIDREDPSRPVSSVDQPFRVGDAGRDRLVDDDVATRLECADAERDVGPIRRRDHDDLDIGSVESSSNDSTMVASGCSRRASACRSGREVAIAATRSPSTAATNGAWKDRPASPYPTMPTPIDPVEVIGRPQFPR